jgi:hypothetical protein
MELGRSTAVAVLKPNWKIEGSSVVLDTDTLAGQVCREERFSSDPSLSYACSGFLVAPNLLVTAGHCQVNFGETKNQSGGYCEVYDWLFGYQMEENGKPAVLSPDNLYHCKRIVYAVFDEKEPFRDYALVELDRPVAGRRPLGISRRAPRVGDEVSMIGYPLGTPMKLSRNARVTRNDLSTQEFVTNLDAFEGNSGSAVFDAEGKVAGILVNGNPTEAFAEKEEGQCSVYNRCDENGKNCLVPDENPASLPGFQAVGSGVQRIAPVLDWMKTSKNF